MYDVRTTAIVSVPTQTITVGLGRKVERTYVGDQALKDLAATAALFGRTIPGEVLDQIRVVFFGEFDTDTGNSDE